LNHCMIKDFTAQKNLAETFVFQSLNTMERQHLYQFSKLQKIKSRQFLNSPKSVYCLLSGCLKNENQKIQPGSYVGLEALFLNQQSNKKFQATIQSTVIQISVEVLKELMRTNTK